MKTNTDTRTQTAQPQTMRRVAYGDNRQDLQEVLDTVGKAVTTYANKHPGAFAVAVFFTGFYVGWKVKPW